MDIWMWIYSAIGIFMTARMIHLIDAFGQKNNQMNRNMLKNHFMADEDMFCIQLQKPHKIVDILTGLWQVPRTSNFKMFSVQDIVWRRNWGNVPHDINLCEYSSTKWLYERHNIFEILACQIDFIDTETKYAAVECIFSFVVCLMNPLNIVWYVPNV